MALDPVKEQREDRPEVARLSLDWIAVIAALAAIALVRLGVLPHVSW